MTSLKLEVDLGDRSYPIHIGSGLLFQAGRLLFPDGHPAKVFVIADETVDRLHGADLRTALEAWGLRIELATVPSGETSKSYAQWQKLVDWTLSVGVERTDGVIAFGGGVVGDLAGFVAASVLRGINFVQIPTTLLSQVDSSVGGKTGINTRFGKNLVGAFHQPRCVLIDTDLLQTLPERERLAGYSEVVKYGLLGSRDFFEWLEGNATAALAGDQALLNQMVYQSCSHKAAIVARDEKEADVRGLLNLGHTFGHALEACFDYDGRLLHGEAIAIGMGLAFDVSQCMGWCTGQETQRVKRHFQHMGLSLHLPGDLSKTLDLDKIKDHMTRDKKVQAGTIKFVMVRGIGQAFITSEVPMTLIDRFLQEWLAVCEYAA